MDKNGETHEGFIPEEKMFSMKEWNPISYDRPAPGAAWRPKIYKTFDEAMSKFEGRSILLEDEEVWVGPYNEKGGEEC